MRNQSRGAMIAVALAAAVVSAIISVTVTRTAGQAARPARTVDGKPNFNGIWQALNEAHWDLEAHAARAGAVMQEGVYPYEFAQVPAAWVLPATWYVNTSFGKRDTATDACTLSPT